MTDSANNEHERRQSLRIDMEKELIDISWQDAQGHAHQKRIACLDVSRGGIKIDSDQAIAENTIVTVVFKPTSPDRNEVQAKVLRCIEDEGGWYYIAMQLAE